MEATRAVLCILLRLDIDEGSWLGCSLSSQLRGVHPVLLKETR